MTLKISEPVGFNENITETITESHQNNMLLLLCNLNLISREQYFSSLKGPRIYMPGIYVVHAIA